MMRLWRAVPLALVCLGVIAAIPVALGMEISPEVQQLERSLENKIQEKIRALYGDQLKVAINVHVVVDPPASPKSDANMGYAPFPTDFLAENESSESIMLAAIEVDIKAPEEIEEKQIENLKALVEMSLKGLAPKITISRVPMPKTPLSSLNEFAWKTEWKFLSTLIAVLLIALILTFGVGMSLRSSANAIAEGLKASSAAAIENKTALTLNGAMGDGKKSDAPPPPPVSTEKEYERNIQIVQQVLRDNPLILVQTLRDSDTEWLGLRSLLPSLSEEERGTLKKCLGDRVSRLVADESRDMPEAIDSAGWLRDFVERVMLRKVQGGSEVERILGPDMTVEFSLSHYKSLLKAAQAIDERGGWRILTEFYPKDRMGSLFKEVSETQWWNVVSSAEVSPEEIKSAAGRMVEEIRKTPFGGENEERNRFYRNRLLNPMVNYLKSIDLNREDEVLESLSQNSPDLAQMVRTRVWTPSQLDLVPDDHLKIQVRGGTYEQKAALLAVLPEPQAKRLESLLPDGNVKTIAIDQAGRIKAAGETSPDYRRAVETAREFLEMLRRQAEEGSYELLSDASGVIPMREAA